MMEQASCLCPTCGQHFTGEQPRVDQINRIFICGSGAVLLSEQQMLLAAKLVKALPHPAMSDSILVSFYGGGEGPQNEIANLRVIATLLRRKLRPLGWNIKNVHGTGYKLVALEDGEDEQEI